MMNELFWNRIQKVISTLDVEGNLNAIFSELKDILSTIDLADLDEEISKTVVFELRKYGRGAKTLAPLGYFHPSEIISLVVKNAKRGTITQNPRNSVYTYDFNAKNEVVRIECPGSLATSLCMRFDKLSCFIICEKAGEFPEICGIYLVEYDDNGNALLVVETLWLDNMNTIARISIEQYQGSTKDTRQCDVYTCYPVQYGGSIVLEKESYQVFYDNGKAIDWKNVNG